MNYDIAQSILTTLGVAGKLAAAVSLGNLFLWAVAFYILHQMYQLRFLKILMFSQILWIIEWFWCRRYHWIGYPTHSSVDGTLTHDVIRSLLDSGFYFTPIILNTIGVIMVVRYLQVKWTESEDRQQNAGT